MRELATLRRVESVSPIENADAIECLKIGGWRVVSRKGNFVAGDLALYLEIDSFLPASDERFEDVFQGKGKRTFEGVEGYRLKTIKLRGQVSQGLALPISLFPELEDCNEDDDVSMRLGVVKYEAPEHGSGGNCNAKGNFPWFIRKTDEPRVQNLKRRTWEEMRDEAFIPSLKLDGSSTTVYHVKDSTYFIKPEEGEVEQVGVCSRNLLLDIESNPDSHFVKGVKKSNLIEIVKRMGRDMNKNIALQGETIGPGIVRSWEKVQEPETLVFSIFDIDKQEYLNGWKLVGLVNGYEIPSTTFYEPVYPFRDYTQDELVAMAEGPSLINPIREGLVFKQMFGEFSFKAISNKFLLKGGE